MENKLTNKVNELGMIAIPQIIRKELDIKAKDRVKLLIENENIILKKITNNVENNENITVRTVDEFGRITIPFETRKMLNISTGDEIEIFIKEKNVILKSA